MRLFFGLLLLATIFIAQGCKTPTAAKSPPATAKVTRSKQPEPAPPHIEKNLFVAGEVIVRFAAAADERTIGEIVSATGLQIIKTVSQKRKTYLYKLPAGLSVPEAMATLSKQTGVLYAEPNLIYQQTR